jgi:hypothetical protein
MVRLVEDQQGTRQQLAELVAQAGRIRLVDQQTLGNEKARVRGPGIGAVTPFATNAGQVFAVEDGGRKPKARFELVAPLQQHRRRAHDDDVVNLPTEQQFARNEPGLDRLAKADVIGNEEIDARKLERLAQWLQLIRLDLDASPERRLEEGWVCRGDAVPPHGVEERGEQPRRVEALVSQLLPPFFALDLGIELLLPQDRQGLALRVILKASETDDGAVVLRAPRLVDRLDKPLAHAHLDDVPWGGRLGDLGHTAPGMQRRSRCDRKIGAAPPAQRRPTLSHVWIATCTHWRRRFFWRKQPAGAGLIHFPLCVTPDAQGTRLAGRITTPLRRDAMSILAIRTARDEGH